MGTNVWVGGESKGEPNPLHLNFDDLEEMATDPQVEISLALVRLPMIALNWTVTCFESEEIQKFVDENLRKIWVPLMANSLMALDYGFSAQEKRWEQNSRGQWVWKSFLSTRQRNVDLLRVENDFDGFKQTDVPLSETTGKGRVQADKAFVFTYDRARAWGSNYGRPRTFASHSPWWMKRQIRRFTGIYYERGAMPLMEGRAPTIHRVQASDGSTEELDGLKFLYDEIIKKLSADKNGYVLPSQVDDNGNKLWDVVPKETSQRGIDYIKFMEYLDLAISRGIVVPDLMAFQNLRSGSRAMSQSHGQTFWKLQCGLADMFKADLEMYAIRQLIDYNFGPDAPSAFWEYEPLSPEVVQWLKELVDRMVAKGTAVVDLEEVSERLGIGVEKATIPPTQPPLRTPTDGRNNDNRDDAGRKALEGNRGEGLVLW
jgi:hypothetical protein